MRFLIAILCIPFSVTAQPVSVETELLKQVKNPPCTSVKDQYMSGTCWSFSSNSFIESEVMKNRNMKVDLSEMFVARYSYIRKIETWLKNKGTTFFTPGGQFHDVVWVMKHYGMVPEAAYNGKPNGERNHNHAALDTLIKHYTEELLAEQVYSLSANHYRYLDSVFNHYLGNVPKDFFYEGKAYNPKSYLKEYLKINPDDFIEITSYNHHPFYTSFVLEDKYNWTGDAYYNVPVADFISITNNALKNGYTIGWDGDVDEPGFDFYGGFATLPQPVVNLQQERQKTFEDKSTDIDHMMHIVAVAKDKTGKQWYYTKNSWGSGNPLNGFIFMSSDYFAIKTSAIIVNKKAIPLAIRQKLKM